MKKAEREYLDKVAALGCLICGNHADIHHVRQGMGMAQRAPHIGGTIPLCKLHHQDGGFGVAIHAGQKTFERRHGTEQEMLDRVKNLLIAEELKQTINRCILPF